MRTSIYLISLCVACAFKAFAEPTPHYINSTPQIGALQIDAISFENRSLFDVSSGGGFFGGSRPFETFNTLNFTNTGSGTMNGTPGFLFDHSFLGGRAPMANWVNRGLVSGTTWVWIESTNIASSGQGLGVGARGVIHVKGESVNLSRSSVYSGSRFGGGGGIGGFFGVGGPESDTYSEGAIFDQYWASSSNNVPAASLALTLPSPQTPDHRVTTTAGRFGGNQFVTLPSTLANAGTYTSFAFTNVVADTNFIQVVFVPTNGVDKMISIDVRFRPNFDNVGPVGFGQVALVRFGIPDIDPITQVAFTNFIYLEDYLAYQTTNLFLAGNRASGTSVDTYRRRPNTYLLTRADRSAQFSGGVVGNATFDPDWFTNPAYLSNSLAMAYTAFSGRLILGENAYGNGNFFRPGIPEWSGLPINDITNFAGRIEIDAKHLNLDQVRLRAESGVIIKTDDLVGNKAPIMDAPLMTFDFRSTQPQLLISNLIPATANRLIGEISAWSGIWQNATTNGTTVTFYDTHVLVVDQNLSITQQVVLQDLKLRGTNVVIADAVTMGRELLIEAQDFTILPSGALTNSPGADVRANNLVGIINFTNLGSFTANRDLVMGSDRPLPYSNIVNLGTITAGAMSLSSDQIINSNLLQTTSSSVTLNAGALNFYGTNSILSTGDVILSGDDLFATNSTVTAGFGGSGALVLAFTNSVHDAGINSSNLWTFNEGLILNRVPLEGDLLGTTFYSIAPDLNEVIHYSAAHDFGVDPIGYSNNLALGHLVLDGGSNSLFRFSPPAGESNVAFYVDFLELVNQATNYQDSIVVDEGVTLYFANSSISPKKLNHLSNDRIRWVSTFAGPLSTTNVVYPSTTAYPLNLALVTSTDIDSDNDGVANVNDPTPVWVSEDINLVITTTNLPPLVPALTWNALQSFDDGTFINYATNFVEFIPDMSAMSWTILTNFTAPLGPPQSLPYTYVDSPGTNYPNRMYRIRVQVQDP